MTRPLPAEVEALAAEHERQAKYNRDCATWFRAHPLRSDNDAELELRDRLAAAHERAARAIREPGDTREAGLAIAANVCDALAENVRAYPEEAHGDAEETAEWLAKAIRALIPGGK